MYPETIDRSGLERAQKGLLPKQDSGLRGGDEQREFLSLVAKNPSEFCKLVRSWGLTQGKLLLSRNTHSPKRSSQTRLGRPSALLQLLGKTCRQDLLRVQRRGSGFMWR